MPLRKEVPIPMETVAAMNMHPVMVRVFTLERGDKGIVVPVESWTTNKLLGSMAAALLGVLDEAAFALFEYLPSRNGDSVTVALEDGDRVRRGPPAEAFLDRSCSGNPSPIDDCRCASAHLGCVPWCRAAGTDLPPI